MITLSFHRHDDDELKCIGADSASGQVYIEVMIAG